MNTTEQLDQLDQETLDLKNWSKGWIRSGNRMNIEVLLCEVGLHLLYDWEGEYTYEKRAQIIEQHEDKYPEKQIVSLPPWDFPPARKVMTCRDFIDTVISDMRALLQLTDFVGEEFCSATFEQFEQALPKNSLEDKFLAISNCNRNWVFSSKDGSGESKPYTLQDKIEYRIINTILDDIDDYRRDNEEDEYEEEEEYSPRTESDEEEMSEEERKEMCSKGLEILESIMDTDDQRLCEGHFVELCNLLKELHRT